MGLHFWLNMVSNLWPRSNFHFEATYTICSIIEHNQYNFSSIFFISVYILLERYWQIRGNPENCNKIFQAESYSTHNYSEVVGNTVQKLEDKILCYMITNNWFSGSGSWDLGITLAKLSYLAWACCDLSVSQGYFIFSSIQNSLCIRWENSPIWFLD